MRRWRMRGLMMLRPELNTLEINDLVIKATERLSLVKFFAHRWDDGKLGLWSSYTLFFPFDMNLSNLIFTMRRFSGDEGWLVQLEARASLGAISPYAFYDHGEVQVDAKPELNPGPAAPDVERSGLGLGVRFALAGWSLDTALAWRATSDRPTSDTKRESKPRIWAQARYGF